jgi:hypothetical protein
MGAVKGHEAGSYVTNSQEKVKEAKSGVLSSTKDCSGREDLKPPIPPVPQVIPVV